MSRKKQGLSPVEFFTIGFGGIVGVGWAVTINSWMATAGGPIPAAVGFVLTCVLIMPVAMCYAELSPMLPVAGACVAFTYKGFGEKAAFVSGWAAILAFISVLPWEAIYINNILAYLVPGVQEGTVLYSVMGSPIHLRSLLIGLGCAAVMFLVNWFGAKSSVTLQKILCTILLCSITITIVFSLIHADFSNLKPVYENVGVGTHQGFFGGVMAMMTLAPFFLFGFETIPQGIEEASGDMKNVGRTIFLSMLAACLTYSLLLLVLGMAYPWQEIITMNTPAAANVMAAIYPGWLGKILWVVILLGVLAGLIGVWNAFLIATPRLLLGLGRAGLIPFVFRKLHPKYGTPSVALIICGLASALGPFLGISVISLLTSVTTAALLVCWFSAVCSLIRLRKKYPDLPRPYRLKGGVGIAAFGAVTCTAFLLLIVLPIFPSYIGNTGLIVLGVWAVLGFLVYLCMGKQRASVSPAERDAALFAKMKEREVS